MKNRNKELINKHKRYSNCPEVEEALDQITKEDILNATTKQHIYIDSNEEIIVLTLDPVALRVKSKVTLEKWVKILQNKMKEYFPDIVTIVNIKGIEVDKEIKDESK
jgi:hypothetical protein